MRIVSYLFLDIVKQLLELWKNYRLIIVPWPPYSHAFKSQEFLDGGGDLLEGKKIKILKLVE